MRAQIASASTIVARWRGHLLDILFPTRCVSCDRLGEPFCVRCRSQIRFVTPPYCARCGRALRVAGAPCPTCRTSPLHLDRLYAVAYHERTIRDALHALKYKRRSDLAAPLATLLEQFLQRTPLHVDAVTAVPLHPSRRRERGYNQAELLARELAPGFRCHMWKGLSAAA